jgi:heme oxygenase (biliverdin-IX-beta and delta-forming)
VNPTQTAFREEARCEPLGRRLRTETRAAHEAAETAFDLERRLATPAAYAEVLELMQAHHRAWAPTLALVAPRLPAELRDGPRLRLVRLGEDLAGLGRRTPQPRAPEPADPPVAPSEDHALGAWYVMEGAALGGLLIRAEVRRRLPEVEPATRYFAGEGRRTAARWRGFQAVLDGWGQRAGGPERVVEGALAAFASLTERLAAAP